MRLAFDRFGMGPVVVLLHGFPLDRLLWDEQSRALSDHFQVVTPDLRGHGHSPSPAGTYLMEELAADVLETLDDLGPREPFVLGGLSMGGYVALALAEMAPERLKGLLLVNTRSAADSPETARKREETAASVEATGSIDAVVDAMIPRLFSPNTVSTRPELISEWSARMRQTPASGVVGALRGMAARPDRSSVLSTLNVPVLVIAGADDQIVPVAEAEAMSRLPRLAELVVLPEAGHLAPLEQPAATTRAIRQFLERMD